MSSITSHWRPMWATTASPRRVGLWSREEAREKVRQRIALYEQRKLGKFPIFLKQTGEFIGTCGIEPFDLEGEPEVELGYRLCLKFWGKGYAKEAAEAILRYGSEELKLVKIMAFVLPQNRASVKILEQLGFRYLRDFMHADLSHRLYEFPRAL